MLQKKNNIFFCYNTKFKKIGHCRDHQNKHALNSFPTMKYNLFGIKFQKTSQLEA